jgi:hypothetical protein
MSILIQHFPSWYDPDGYLMPSLEYDGVAWLLRIALIAIACGLLYLGSKGFRKGTRMVPYALHLIANLLLCLGVVESSLTINQCVNRQCDYELHCHSVGILGLRIYADWDNGVGARHCYCPNKTDKRIQTGEVRFWGSLIPFLPCRYEPIEKNIPYCENCGKYVSVYEMEHHQKWYTEHRRQYAEEPWKFASSTPTGQPVVLDMRRVEDASQLDTVIEESVSRLKRNLKAGVTLPVVVYRKNNWHKRFNISTNDPMENDISDHFDAEEEPFIFDMRGRTKTKDLDTWVEKCVSQLKAKLKEGKKHTVLVYYDNGITRFTINEGSHVEKEESNTEAEQP